MLKQGRPRYTLLASTHSLPVICGQLQQTKPPRSHLWEDRAALQSAGPRGHGAAGEKGKLSPISSSPSRDVTRAHARGGHAPGRLPLQTHSCRRRAPHIYPIFAQKHLWAAPSRRSVRRFTPATRTPALLTSRRGKASPRSLPRRAAGTGQGRPCAGAGTRREPRRNSAASPLAPRTMGPGTTEERGPPVRPPAALCPPVSGRTALPARRVGSDPSRAAPSRPRAPAGPGPAPFASLLGTASPAPSAA